MRRIMIFLMLAAAPLAQERPLPDYDSFAAQVRKRLATDEERQSSYTYIERRTEQKVDSSGRPTSSSVKVYEIYPGLPGQELYRRLIEEDNRPVPPDALARKDRDRQEDVEKYLQAQSSESQRQKAAREHDKARRRLNAAVDDLFRIYDIRMIRREPVDGHGTIVASLSPRPGVKPQTDDGKVMQNFKALAWISESDYEIVRVEIEAVDDLSFGLGLLARV